MHSGSAAVALLHGKGRGARLLPRHVLGGTHVFLSDSHDLVVGFRVLERLRYRTSPLGSCPQCVAAAVLSKGRPGPRPAFSGNQH
jgi:hypothetical protein